MRLNVLVLVGVFALLAVFYGRQLSTAQRVQGMPAGTSTNKDVTSSPSASTQTQPVIAEKPAPTAATPTAENNTAAPSPSAVAETKPPAPESQPPTPATNPPTPESKPPAPATTPPSPENKPAADNKAQVAESRPPTPESKPPTVAAKAPAPEGKPPVSASKPPAPPAAQTKPARQNPSPPKVVANPKVAAERVALSINTLRQIARALQSYFHDTQRYPTELRELTPKYLGAIPLEPCTNQPYYYIPVNTPPMAYILTTGRYPGGSLCRSVSPGLSYLPETGIQNSP